MILRSSLSHHWLMCHRSNFRNFVSPRNLLISFSNLSIFPIALYLLVLNKISSRRAWK